MGTQPHGIRNTGEGDALANDSQQTGQRQARSRKLVWRILFAGCVILGLVLLPPFLSLSRYQRRITQSMSQILGRPVHMDRVSLHLLPFPAFQIENLVIEEIPSFGNEPVLRAAVVDARLRLLPLWHHRVEFSRLSFHDPSVNLTRTATLPTRWNLESVLLQAAHIDAAPTAQTYFGTAPRFPYIEADGARINLKVGSEKTPYSFTDADFALWLPEPQEWRMRLRAHPARTDTSAADTGSVQVEATLRRAPALSRIPIDAMFSWTGAPLGEASRVVFGRDVSLRGDLTLTGSIHGLLDDATLKGHLQVENLHRSDFVPDHTMDLDVSCTAHLTRILHTAEAVRCRWPLPGTGNLPMILTGTVSDLASPSSAQLVMQSNAITADTVLNILRTVSDRISPTLEGTGSLAVQAHWNGTTSSQPLAEKKPQHVPIAAPNLSFSADVSTARLTLHGGRLSSAPVTILNGRLLAVSTADSLSTLAHDLQFSLTPTQVMLEPDRSAVLRVQADNQGLEGTLVGSVPLDRLFDVGAVLPMIGDGLSELPHPTTQRVPATKEGASVTLDVSRQWGSPQVWTLKKGTSQKP